MTPSKTAFLFALAAPLFAAELGTQPDLIAHEWGTFTSVAGADGAPVRWSPLTGPPDLPCFVVRATYLSKGEISSLVRMETPVLYFYTARPMNVSVDVKFPMGTITEWYPKASHIEPGRLSWDAVQLAPGENPPLSAGAGESRYFAARNTDATPLNAGGQWEKMIFYRGVGSFAVPLRPTFTGDGIIQIRNVSQHRVPIAIVFENRGGRLGYRIAADLHESTTIEQEPVTIEPPDLSGTIGDIRGKIADALVERGGLYPKEAQAMLDTWQDSWFEEGMRVIYILPQPAVDAVLPLTVQPAPAQITRAFVGRIELLSPAVRHYMQMAIATGDIAGLEKFGRFLEPFAAQLKLSGGLVAKASSDLEARFSSKSCVP
jgi:hypothetical protein